MSKSIVVASGAVDAQAVTGAVSLVGFSVREDAGTPAVATVVLRDGTADTDPVRVVIELAASESQTATLPAVEFGTGVFVERAAGTTELVLYYS